VKGIWLSNFVFSDFLSQAQSFPQNVDYYSRQGMERRPLVRHSRVHHGQDQTRMKFFKNIHCSLDGLILSSSLFTDVKDDNRVCQPAGNQISKDSRD
jgi:hypothetical protein